MNQNYKGVILKKINGIWSMKLYYKEKHGGGSYQLGGMYTNRISKFETFKNQLKKTIFWDE